MKIRGTTLTRLALYIRFVQLYSEELVLFFRQVLMVLSQLEGSGGYSIGHRLVHRVANSGMGLGDWGQGQSNIPAITSDLYGLHAARPL